MEKATRLLTLDAMRGLAAIAVVLFHLPYINIFPHAYLAVDFFFMLSGFVIARTYDEKLTTNTLSLLDFMKHRLVRLYPLYLLGLFFGLIRCAGQILLARPDQLSPTQLVISMLCGIAFLPSPITVFIAPINGPGWSLLFELYVNIVYAYYLVRLRARARAVVACISLLCMILLVGQHGSVDIGFNGFEAYGGLIRVMFSFVIGIVLARNINANISEYSLIGLAPIILVVLFFFPITLKHRGIYDLFVTLLASPTLVYFGAKYQPPAVCRKYANLLGDISYPLYILHYPLLWSFGFAARMAQIPNWLWMSLFVLFILPFSYFINMFWDRPMKSRLIKIVVT